MNSRLRDLLIKHEGVRLRIYTDTVGKLTIGCGRNLDDVGITQIEAMNMLSYDMLRVTREAVDHLIWFRSLDRVRQDVVLSMIFNLGMNRFLGFKRAIEALRTQNYALAADEMLKSKWATQVGIRAIELAEMMRTGSYGQYV